MQPKIRFRHRRHEMPAHHRVPIDPVDLVPEGCEEMVERGVAPELRGTDHQRRDVLSEDAGADLGSLADAADIGAGVEGRAHLVMTYGRIQVRQALQHRCEIPFHPGRRLAAARAGDADGARAGEPFALSLCRRDGEQDRRHAAGGESFHDLGRAGQVVAVIGEQENPSSCWQRCGAACHVTASEPPKVASEAASSRCSRA